ncbi:hypothetical protein HMPREF9554_01616 [Treponema phagedenis F0421]|nr:hypothetical protein HMPREF9554_01616 [Treponema phagedenis F0421]
MPVKINTYKFLWMKPLCSLKDAKYHECNFYEFLFFIICILL